MGLDVLYPGLFRVLELLFYRVCYHILVWGVFRFSRLRMRLWFSSIL